MGFKLQRLTVTTRMAVVRPDPVRTPSTYLQTDSHSSFDLLSISHWPPGSSGGRAGRVNGNLLEFK